MSTEPLRERIGRASVLLSEGRLFEARALLLVAEEEPRRGAGRPVTAADWLWELDFQARLAILDELIESARRRVFHREPLMQLGWTLSRRAHDLRRYIDPDLSPQTRVEAPSSAVDDEELLIDSMRRYQQGDRRQAALGFRRVVVSAEHQLKQIEEALSPRGMSYVVIDDYERLLGEGRRILGRWRTLRHAASGAPLSEETDLLASQIERRGLGALVELPREDPLFVDVTTGEASVGPPPSEGALARSEVSDEDGSDGEPPIAGSPDGPGGEDSGGGDPGDPSEPADPSPPKEIRRIPHLDLVLQRPLAPGTRFRAEVYADRRPAADGEASEEIAVTLPPRQRRIVLGAELLVSEHFKLVGASSARRLTVDVDQDQTKTLRFDLQVRSAGELRSKFRKPADMRRGLVSAVFSYQGRPCGSVSREVALAAPGRASKRMPRAKRWPASLRPVLDAERADLVIQIKAISSDGKRFKCKVSTSLIRSRHNNVWRPWEFDTSPEDIVRGYMEGFVDPDLPPTGRRGELVGAGVNLFKVAPENFRGLFWEMVDKKRLPQTIAIVSEEPFIPWELMVPRRVKGKREETLSPLGVLAAIGRYTTGDANSGPQRFRLSRSLVVAPEYSEDRLPLAEAEAELVLGQVPGVALRPALLDPLLAELGREAPDLLHFVGHGADEKNRMQSLLLEQNQRLRASAVPGLPEIYKAFTQRTPLLVLNACEAGRLTPALRGAGGLAQAFIDRGAGGVVAALWTVVDDIAHDVAVEFYREATKNPPRAFAEILRTIRKRAYEGQDIGEDTYAAYCFYGDPRAKRG